MMLHEFRKRPLCYGCGLFLILLFTALYTGWRYTLQAGLICLTLFICCLIGTLFKSGRLKMGLLPAAIGFLAAALAFLTAYTAFFFHYHRLIDPLEGQSGRAVLVVTRPLSTTAYSASCEGKLISLEGEAVGLNGRFYFPYEATFETGDRLSVDLTISPILAEGEGLETYYALSQGLLFRADVNDAYQKTGEDYLFPQSMSSALKKTLSDRLLIFLPPDGAALANALLLGDKSALSVPLKEAFRRFGISHTLAVSGLHLSILLGSLSLLFKKLHLPRRAHFFFLLPPTLFYMLLVGSPSVLRAGIMLLFGAAAHPLGRRRDPLTSLFAAVSLICLISPFSILDIGLLLSFFATLGLLLVGLPLVRRLSSLSRPLNVLLSSLIMTASAITFTLPFSIWYFGEISLIAPLANLLFVPLITLLLYLIPLLLLLSPLPILAATPAYAIRLLTELTKKTAAFGGSRDSFMLPLTLPAIRAAGLIFLTASVLLLCFKRTRPTVLACSAAFLLISGGIFGFHTLQTAKQADVFALSDGSNDALLIHAGTRMMICDSSDGSYSFLKSALTLAADDPSVHADSLLLTHYHAKQLTTITRLLPNSGIEYLLLPEPDESHADLAANLEKRASRAGCKVYYYPPQAEICIGYHDFTLLLDCDEDSSQPPRRLTILRESRTVVDYVPALPETNGLTDPSALLPACHSAKNLPDPSLWNKRYD